MNAVDLLLIAGIGVLVLAGIALVGYKLPARHGLDKEYFSSKWLELLARVKTDDGMALAVIDADKLLDEALKRRRFSGKTMGERMVAAQRSMTDNDAAWFAHKLRNRLVHEANIKLKKKEAVRALEGFKKALKDLGAL